MKKEPATDHIEWLITEIGDALTNTESMPGVTHTLPDLADIDPGKFNRIEVRIGDRPYTISIFQPAGNLMEGILSQVRLEITDEPKKRPIKFQNDHRDNEKLHQLYVGWARESLQVATAACRELWDQSRWPASDLAQAMWEKVCEHVRTDAAWFEAAALEFMEPMGSIVSDFNIRVGPTLANVPPGEYTGHIEARNGKLYFELDDDVMPQGD